MTFEPRGVIPAVLLPFDDQLDVDVSSYRRHLRRVGATDGLTAITVNGHASEVSSCTADEQRRALEVAVEELGDRLPIVSGVYADGSHEAARIAAAAERDGASALLVFPPESYATGVRMRPEMAREHYGRIAEATDLPLIHFQYSQASGRGLLLDDLVDVTASVPSIVAIKDWAGDPQLHEHHVRTLQSLSRPVAVLSTHSAWLLASLAVGPWGVLSGAGSVYPERLVALFEAIVRDDLAAAREAWASMWPLAAVIYSDPWVDMHNRMKWLLHDLGEISSPAVRPPLVAVTTAEAERLRAAAHAAELALPAAVDVD